jgi:hypothetical protein
MSFTLGRVLGAPGRKVSPVCDIKFKFFGRHKRGSIRDGVILSVQESKP